MKLLFPLSLLGAAIGGLLGAIFAFYFTVAAGGGEVLCLVVNIGLAIGGAFLGVVAVKAIRDEKSLRAVEILVPVALGLVCGIIGYE